MSRFTFRQAASLILALGWADYALKYRGSMLGFAWSFVVPLVKFIVILHIFRPFVTDIPQYPLYLFLGLLLWEHFAMTTSACITMLHDKAAIIHTIVLPRIVLILSVGWTHVIILLSYLAIFFLCAVLLGADLSAWSIALLPIVVVQATLLALGIGMLLSAYALRFRDIPHLWSVMLQVLFWLTPVLYSYNPSLPLEAEAQRILSGSVGLSLWSVFDIFIRFQPLSVLMFAARRYLLYAHSLGVPSTLHLGAFTSVCIIIFAIGAVVFQRRSRYFVEEY